MKTVSLISISILALLAGCATPGGSTAKEASRTEVLFDHPENFTDVKDASSPTDKGRDSILSEIKGFLQRDADARLPEGFRLKVVFTDIDLAGDFEPWRGPDWMDVRIVKSIYPPAMKFSYTVTDASGRVVLQGTESQRDMAFDTRVLIDTTDPFRYEKAMLDDWVRSKLQGLKKS